MIIAALGSTSETAERGAMDLDLTPQTYAPRLIAHLQLDDFSSLPFVLQCVLSTSQSFLPLWQILFYFIFLPPSVVEHPALEEL